MNKAIHIHLLYLVLILLGMGMSACTSKDEEIVNKVDFLNDLAYENHYVAVDSVQKYAWLATKMGYKASRRKSSRVAKGARWWNFS